VYRPPGFTPAWGVPPASGSTPGWGSATDPNQGGDPAQSGDSTPVWGTPSASDPAQGSAGSGSSPGWGSAAGAAATFPSSGSSAPAEGSTPTVNVGCFGCLLWVIWAAVWAVVAFLPLSVSDDIFGPLQGAHWALFPAESAPIGTGSDPDDADDQKVRVPPGSRMTLNVEEQDADFVFSDFEPTIRCFTRDSAGPWQELPVARIPVVQTPDDQSKDLDLVRLNSFRAVTGELTVRCVGTEVLDLRRDDPGVQRRLSLTIGAFKYLWPALVTLILWGPVALVIRRRRRKAAQAAQVAWSSGPVQPPSSGLPPPYTTP
jgi:hypothetical protein